MGANHTFLKGLIAILASFVIIILILIGMMNGVLTWAADFEPICGQQARSPLFLRHDSLSRGAHRYVPRGGADSGKIA